MPLRRRHRSYHGETVPKSEAESLARKQEQLLEAESIAHVGSWEQSYEPGEVVWSDELFRILGFEPGAFAPTPGRFFECVHPDDRAVFETMQQQVDTGAIKVDTGRLEYRIVRPSGEIRFVRAHGRMIRDAAGPPLRVYGTVQDITEQKQLEAQLVFVSRMTAVGMLGAGVAHEINNPLASVSTSIEVATQQVVDLAETVGPNMRAQLEDVREVLGEAKQAALRIRNIVRDLSAFGQLGTERGPVDVRPLVDGAIKLVWNEIRHRARLVKSYDEIPLVDANENQLCQVFVNVLLNAAQAIGEGDVEHNEIHVTTRAASGGAVSIEITDTGGGIAAEHLPRIFEPFFTTKPIGSALGLGLSTAHAIISGFGGTLEVVSELGRGSRFRIVLPAVRRSEPKLDARRERARTNRDGRVLVVDDELTLLRNIERSLTKYHDVVAVERAAEALELIAAGERFDAIVCDLMMPEMTGMQLFGELQRIAPDQAERTIFITGGAFSTAAREFLERVPNPRLEKPFEIRQLRTVIKSIVRS